MKLPALSCMLCAACAMLPFGRLSAQLSITVVNTPVTQNFNTLPASGTDLPATGGIFTEGWSFLESGSNKNVLFQAGTGSSTTGDTYSFGAPASTDRAWGVLQTGSLSSVLGFTFSNNTGQTISSVTVGFTGEVWRLSAAQDALAFSYQVGNVPLDQATGWSTVPALRFTTPGTGSGAVDGNHTANRTIIAPFTITGLYIPKGTTVTFRWVDETATNSSAMAIDDFTLTLWPAFTGYFRTRNTGNWNDLATWETSTDGMTWSAATTTVPTDLSAGTTIRSGHTVTVTSTLAAGKISIQPGGKKQWASGDFTLADAAGDDLVLMGPAAEWEMAATTLPGIMGNATIRVGSGAVLKLTGHNNLLVFHSNAYHYAHEAVFEYSHTTAPSLAGTLFRVQDADAIPVFWYNSPATTVVGSSAAMTVAGRIAIAGGRTLNLNNLSGPLTSRNGITGEGNFMAASAVAFTGAQAILGGSGTVHANLTIQTGCTTTLISDKLFANNRNITVGGTLDLGLWQLRTVSGTATLSNSATGTLRTSRPEGLLAANGSLLAGAFSLHFAPGSTVDYSATGHQVVSVTGVPAYQHLVLSGTGTKTAQSGGNLVVQGSCLIQAGATLALSGSPAENLYLNNSAGLQVAAGGTFDNGGESSITSSGGTPSISIAGTFCTRDAQGFTGPGASIPSIMPVLLPGSTIHYSRAGDQLLQAIHTYENLVCSGSGTKTPSSALALNETLTISGSAVLNGASHTIGGTATNLVMTGTSRLVLGVTGTQPAMGGDFSLAPGTTIEFANMNSTTAFIRQGGSPVIHYADIDITGSNITAPHSGITLQAGATLRVKSGGVLKLTSVNGLYAPSGAAIRSTNTPAVDLQPGSTIDYSGAAQAITTPFAYSRITLSGTGEKTASAPFTVTERFTLSGDASLKGSSPDYSAGATLAYVDAAPGRSYIQGREWPQVNPPHHLLVNLGGAGSPSVRLTADRTIDGDLSLARGALDLDGMHLQVGGNITGSGTLTGSSVSALTLQGGTATLHFTQTADGVTNALGRLVIKDGLVMLASRLQLYDVLDLAGGTLDLADRSLVLKSGPSQTARVAERKGTLLGATRVTVERYISGTYLRRWRLLTAPVAGTSINAAWQEGRTWSGDAADNLSPGYGTLITGQQQGTSGTANANGFDFWNEIAGSQASIRRYQGSTAAAGASWQPLASTLTSDFTNGNAYLLFVRGDRSVTTTGGATVLRATGALREPQTFTVPVSTTQSHTLIGNPFASPLHFRKVYEGNPGLIKPYFWIWQASLSATGGYALVKPETEGSTVYEVIPSGSSATTPVEPVISSGEGFFVVPADLSSSPGLVVQQAHKATENSAISVLRQTGERPAKLYLNLYTTGVNPEILLDGVLLQVAEPGNASKQAGIGKAVNSAENLSLYELEKDWQVAIKSLPPAGGEMQLRLWNTSSRSYQLRVRSRDFTVPGMSVWLWDRFLDKELPISLGTAVTTYEFAVGSEEASRHPLRFRIIFRAAVNAPLPLRLISLKAVWKAAGVQVEWQAGGEEAITTYAVERSLDGQSFSQLGLLPANGGQGPSVYQFLDTKPAERAFYRLKIMQADGGFRYSPVVRWERVSGMEDLRVIPNPVKDGKLQLQVVSKAGGLYSLALYTKDGKLVWRKDLQHSGGTASWWLDLEKGLPAGVYTLRFRNNRKSGSRQVLII